MPRFPSRHSLSALTDRPLKASAAVKRSVRLQFNLLEEELWRRRQGRPSCRLVLGFARLSAQRDAARFLIHPTKAPDMTEKTPSRDLDYELWRRTEDRRDAARSPHLPPQDQKLFSLVLSLARLAARRDSLGSMRS